MSILTIKSLSYCYDKENVLEDLNLSINKKDFLAVIGPNGGGKSTLLKLILGINKVQKGEIKIFGDNPCNNYSKIGYVPQNTNINTDFPIKVLEVVMMGHVETSEKLKVKSEKWWTRFGIGYKNSETACAMGALKQVGMEEFAHKKIGSLSGGQRQRVMIARALCAHPSLLLLDEPTASIDVKGQKDIYELLKELNKTITVVVVSHDITAIFGYANKVAHINKGLTFHDISDKQNFECEDDEHFCEVEMFKLMGEKSCGC